MSDQRPTKHIHPTILQRARELRREMTSQERKLWQCLRGKKLYGIKFRRQHPIDRFILDFFCYAHNLAVEIDGHSHYEPDQEEYDQVRTEWLARYGIRVIRFTNRDVDTNIEGVLDGIARACGVGDDLPPSNSPQGGENRTAQGEPDFAPTGSEPGFASNRTESDPASTGREPDFASTGSEPDFAPNGSKPEIAPKGGEPDSPPLGGD